MSKSKQVALRSYFSFMRQHKLKSFFVFGCFVASNIMIALIPIYIGKLTGALSGSPIDRSAAISFTIILIALSSGHSWSWRICELVFLKFIQPLSYAYENIVFEKTIRQPYPYFVDKFTGKVSAYISTLRQEFEDFLNHLFFEYTSHVIGLVALGIILTSVNWQTGLVFGLGIVGMAIVGKFSLRYSNSKEKQAADTESTKRGIMVDVIANFVNVKSFRREATEVQQMQKQQAVTFAAVRKSFIGSVFFWGSMSIFVRDIIWPVTIGLNVYLFLQSQLSLAQLATLISAILLFTTTIWDAIWSISQLNLRMARAEQAHRYLFGSKQLHEIAASSEQTQAPTFERSLSLSNLQFAYPDKSDMAVLEDINLSLQKGEKIGIVGKSGSGKTTLTKLLLDYYPALPGTILVDGQPVTSSQIAQLISYVPQDTSMFHRTIAENIAYAADADVTREDIVRAAKQANADEFISKVRDGYDALVGERGVKLSVGQRQRIAIARAFLDDKPLLILDEATSALDSESELLVQEALEALWQNKTVIAIAHRLSTLRHMDRIIVIDKGRIIEEGSHGQLLKQKGAYAKLWAHQSGGFLED